jgi:hypothetical protein
MMGGCSSPDGKQPKAGMSSTSMTDLERLILENIELRQTAADLALQTAILRESLNQTRAAKQRLGYVDS